MDDLPVGGNRFVGRGEELAAAKAALRRGRLLTLTGGPGVGKTRLAAQLALRSGRSFPGGVWFVELAPLRDEEMVADAVAEALRAEETTLGFQKPPTRSVIDAVADHVSDARALLILDNCEHLVGATARLAYTLLRRCDRLRILATSRQTLRVAGEQVLTVGPLPAPDPDDIQPPSAAARSDAVRLFADRAAVALRGFRLTDDNRPVVARLCHRLEGNPLAIELAAVKVRTMPVEQILRRLDGFLGPLAEVSGAGAAHLPSPRSAIDWSHRLCGPEQRTLWRRLAVFHGGFDLGDAEVVCSGRGIGREDVGRIVADLVDMSIVIREPHEHVFLRYRLPEMIREFGAEELVHSSDDAWMRRRHGEHFLRIAERIEGDPMSRHQAGSLAHLHLECANLRVAADHHLSAPGGGASGLLISAVLARYYLAIGLVSKGRFWLDRALDRSSAPDPARARALWTAGWLTLLQGHTTEGLARLGECRDLAREIGDASALRRVAQFTGLAEIFQGHYDRARLLLTEALTDHHAAGDEDGEWLTLYQLALVSTHLEAHEQAIAYGERSLAICRAHDAAWAEAHAMWMTGLANLWCGHIARAGRLLREALGIKHALEDRWGITRCMEALAWTLAPSRPEDAARLLGAAHRVRRSIGSPPDQFPALMDARLRWRTYLADALGPDRFDEIYRDGADRPLDELVARELGEPTAAR
ncbi:LuxR family transcriptional regulator [Actinoallomurus vinaceus]|uniref:LuxR family transcriptional regulator n=1 Tax=Actinoallomurus vinaceus TaxID=1080074 RepID=A0ABP8UIH6_9ACTN